MYLLTWISGYSKQPHEIEIKNKEDIDNCIKNIKSMNGINIEIIEVK